MREKKCLMSIKLASAAVIRDVNIILWKSDELNCQLIFLLWKSILWAFQFQNTENTENTENTYIKM